MSCMELGGVMVNWAVAEERKKTPEIVLIKNREK